MSDAAINIFHEDQSYRKTIVEDFIFYSGIFLYRLLLVFFVNSVVNLFSYLIEAFVLLVYLAI